MRIHLHSKGVINHPVMFSHFKVGELKTRFTTGEGQTTGLVPVVVDFPQKRKEALDTECSNLGECLMILFLSNSKSK